MSTRIGISTDIEGTAVVPAVSNASQARFYYDQTLNQLRYSQNGGAYQYMLAQVAYWGFNAPGNNTFGTPYQAVNAAAEINGQWSVPENGVLAGLVIRALNANFSASGNCTVNVGGVPTTLLAAYSNAANLFADDTHLVSVVRGDLVSVMVSAALTNNPILVSLLLLPP